MKKRVKGFRRSSDLSAFELNAGCFRGYLDEILIAIMPTIKSRLLPPGDRLKICSPLTKFIMASSGKTSSAI